MARVTILLIAVVLIGVMVGCIGLLSKDLEIRDWYDLHAVRYNLGGKHRLMNDLDATTAGYEELASPTANDGRGWQPIGDELGRFTGSFDGQGYEIRDLFVAGGLFVGLFGSVGGGVIENVGVVNATVTGERFVGGLVGENGMVASKLGTKYWVGSVSNCYFTGNVTGERDVGGLVGVVGRNALGTVSNSYYNYDEVLINGQSIITIGALSGEDFEEWLANDKFLDVNERLSLEGGYYLINDVDDFRQLLAFSQDDSLKFRLKNDLCLSGEPNLYIPYLAGEFDGNGHRISNLSFDFDCVSHVGLFGCLAPTGRVSQVGVENMNVVGVRHVGGLVGFNSGIVSDSYASGSVAGSLGVGGLVASNARGATVRNSYSTGSVIGEEHVGGLVGSNSGAVSNSFWDAQTSGTEESDGGTGKTTAGMMDIATFTDTETEGLDEPWDMIAVAPRETDEAYTWNIVDGETYPFLGWESV